MLTNIQHFVTRAVFDADFEFPAIFEITRRFSSIFVDFLFKSPKNRVFGLSKSDFGLLEQSSNFLCNFSRISVKSCPRQKNPRS